LHIQELTNMPHFYKLAFFNLTFLLLALATANAATPPPVLTNPSACGLGLPINDFSCNANHQFPIDVSSAPGNELGVNVFLREVRLIINHEWAADLDIHLKSPNGVIVELTTDNGSGNDNYGSYAGSGCGQFTAFISHSLPSACNTPSIVNGAAPFIGEFLPEQSLNKFNDGASPIGHWILEICDDGKEHFGTLEFAELVFEATSCVAPALVTVERVDSTSVKLDWLPSGNAGASIIEYGPPGSFSPGSGYTGQGAIATFASPPVVLMGLAPSTAYEIYIRNDCSGGNFSSNSCPVTITTLCSPQPATIIENFDSLPLCDPFCGISCDITGTWRNVPNDHFDWTVYNGPTATTSTGPSDDVPGGGKYIYIETSGSLCRNGNEAVLMSNCIEVQASPNECDMSFNYILYGANVNGVLLQVTTDGGMSWQTLWQATGNLGDQWFRQFIDLDAFDGQVVQFRFTGRGGNGIRGDIALDNIIFYGSTDLGFPPFVKYLDQDGDGYGRPDAFIATCADVNFPGYVSNSTDCDDEDFCRNPGIVETPCDGFDENCSGDDDEFIIPTPAVISDTVCSGEIGWVKATPGFGGQIFWYDAPSGGNLLHTGGTYSPQDFPLNNSTDPVTLTFFAEELSATGCLSGSRQPASITILPKPSISTLDSPEICAGEIFDLNTVNILDANGANGTLSFYQAMPLLSANEISSQVSPAQNQTYYIQSTANGGCTGMTSLAVSVKPSPIASIQGDSTLCLGTSGVLTALDLGNGAAPVSIEWNNGKITSQVNVMSGNFSGATSLYAVKITGANGCASTDTMIVETVTSVDAVQVNVEPVSICNGSNGTIILSPIDGVPPFNYFWNNGAATALSGGLTLDNLTQGAYSFTITDSSPEGCSFFIPVVVVNGPSAVVSVENVKPVNCKGGNDGCITLDVIGTTPSIVWSNGATGESVCGLAAGTYSVTVTDGACENILSIPVTEPEALFAKPNVHSVSCFGKTDGKISLTVLGGTAPYQYHWSNGKVTQNINNLAGGTYSVTVSDARGCQVVLSPLVVGQPGLLAVANAMLRQPGCFGFNDGEITVSATGGNEPFSFAWNNGGAGSTLTNLPTGNYTVTVTDVRGCTVLQSLFLPQPNPVAVAVDEIKFPDCNGIDNGNILITASGGNGGFTYLWNDTLAVEDIYGIGPGFYHAQVTDQMGCAGQSDTIEITGKEDFQIVFNTTNPHCVGIDDGFIEITSVTGGTAPYQFFWNTDESGTSITGLPAEAYSVTVVDAAGCHFEANVTLLETQPMNVDYSAFSPACHGTATGQIVAAAHGGVAPYQFNWSNGHTGPVNSGLVAGNYTATVIDNTGCKFFMDLITLGEPAPLTILVDNVESVACQGGNEGNIEVSVTGGTAPYNYLWSNNHDEEDMAELPKGNYVLTVTDDNGCVTVSPVIEVISPDPIQPVANLVIPPGCQAIQVDTICVGVTGGVAPYQFTWDTGDTSSCLIGAPSGDYHVTITDAAGCTQELMSVKVPEEFIPVAAQAINTEAVEICAGTTDGAVSIVIKGGAAPFQYIWSNGVIGNTTGDTVTIQNLSFGQYNVTITDAGGCTAVSAWMNVTDEGFIAVTAPSSQIQNLKCKQGADGAIDVNIAGGLPGYDFTWLDESGNVLATTEDIDSLAAGTYTILVADSLGCTGSLTIALTEPDEILTVESPPPVIQDVTCFGLTNGKVNISPHGGIPPYFFSWSNGKTTEDITGLGPGAYIVTITDSNNCEYISPVFEISAPGSPVSLAAFEAENASCFGSADGYINIGIQGGTPPYVFNWNQQSVSEDLQNIPAGAYHLMVFDANNCPYDTTFVLDEPDELTLTASVVAAAAGQNNGVIIPAAFGGFGPYSFQLNTGQTGDTLSNLAPGAYELTVVDGHFCETSIWVEVGTLVDLAGHWVLVEMSLFPNPTTGLVNLGINAGEPLDFTIKIFNPLGQAVLIKKEDKIQQGRVVLDLEGYAPGTYVALVMVEGQVVYQSRILVIR
jgi:subtilisin-like proprotein convertase family protein